MGQLNGTQYGQLLEALIKAFPTPDLLTELVQLKFSRNLNEISTAPSIRTIVFKLIEDAQARGWLDQLIMGARESNPGNVPLFVFAQEYGLAIYMPSELSRTTSLERVIRQNNSFIDINQWREKLAVIETQVCRIEILNTNNATEFGTGFLLAPNVVMTNYHVVESVISNPATYKNVVLRFDYKQLNAHVINQGTQYHLEQDWLIDKSPYTNNSLPTVDELDYALLRVDGFPGEEKIGKNPDPNSPQRGWIELPTQLDYPFLPDTPLFIVQHPSAAPLKLAFDTNAIININQNGTTVKYRTNTEPGSSGSPCFDINWNLVALHHSGDLNWNPTYNAGTPFSAICSRLEKQGLLAKLRSGEHM